MTVSIKDIARAAGVSYSTVSRALADSSRVRLETRERIQQLAAEMGYFPSVAARSLVTHRTQTIGLVATTIKDLFQAGVIQVIEETALDSGYSVILAHSGAASERELVELRALQERRVDGIILISVRADGDCAAVLQGNRVPVVFINNVRRDDFGYSVRMDNFGGAQQAVRHLLELGHRRIGYVSGPPIEWDNIERERGYRQALSSYGVDCDATLIVEGNGRPESGVMALRRLLASSYPPTAIFCYNDASALGVMRAAQAAGLRIPQDLAVVGFDDIDLAPYFEPPLTTVAQPKEVMGRKAVEIILSHLNGEAVEKDYILPGRLVLRQSTMVLGSVS